MSKIVISYINISSQTYRLSCVVYLFRIPNDEQRQETG
jgi:hypothetical protein